MSELLASGREADVYALDADRVLRRYRADRDVAAEAELMAHLQRQGFPVPEVYSAHGREMVMQRVAGETLLTAIVAERISPVDAGRVLAELHRELGRVSPLAGEGAPTDRIVHLDLHPDNVIMADAGPVLLDWSNARHGPAEFDLAVSALILAEAAIGLHVPAIMCGPAAETLNAFLTRAGDDVLGGLPRAVALREGNPTLSASERAQVTAASVVVRQRVAPE
ncbi:phosphotransferase [Natronosporangium hydrolyticum]|uniref:Phosphotransferase n=1 Tax=Natronosporangium hydrolyticum TaxID=2811111 RepID=A0A895YFV6_9ACTN|nr:phosphotransferase [Natronosporangium hydrolyticum]QSB14293.1 phosphotransferase [Natronosporangium hydrolyticum]